MRRWAAMRRRLALLGGVLALALSLLAMHQPSIDPADSSEEAATTVMINDHGGDHAALSTMDDHGANDPGHGCADCGDHGASGLAMICCLAAIGLLILSWITRPRGGTRWLSPITRRLALAVRSILRSWSRPPLSLQELAISRT
ncbi:MAG TPA: hypothetical protein VIP98_23850 [Microlunatus sp.]